MSTATNKKQSPQEHTTHSANDKKVKKAFRLNTAWLRNQWAVILMVVFVFASFGVIVYTRAATTPVAQVEAEQMTLPYGARIISDVSASRGLAVRTNVSSPITGLVNLTKATTSLKVVARSSWCNGRSYMSLNVDGQTAMYRTSVSSSTWKSFTVSKSLTAASHKLALYYYGNSSCRPSLYIDSVVFYGETSPVPVAPTVALSASPVTLAAGASATLTWTSTNATSCTATGGWSGAQPTSGSASTGALNANTTYTLSCTGAGGTASALASVDVTNPVPPVVTTESSIYGAPYGPSSLANIRVGSHYGYSPAFRFRADHTGSISGFRFYEIDSGDRPGYSDGNGGTIEMSMQSDDGTANHFPSGTALGQTLTWKPGLTDTAAGAENPGGNDSRFQYHALPAPVQVTKGQLYHLVFKNVDTNFEANYLSVNSLYISRTNAPAGESIQSGLSSTDWGASYRYTGSSWLNSSPESNGSDYSPILDLTWTDGHHQGNGYMEVWSNKFVTLSAAGNVREQFTPKTNRTVNRIVAAAKTITAGSLTARLETSAGVVASSNAVTTGDSKTHWFSFTIPSVTLTAGQTYNLVLSAPSGNATVLAIRDGNRNPFNFDPATTFSDGRAQQLKSGVWANWENEWSTDLVDYADLSVYFTYQ